MNKRYQSIRLLVELRENVRQFPTLADEHIHNTIVESLSKAQRDLWYWIVECEGDTVTSDVMVTFNYTEPYASSLLNELWQFGLLEREMVIDDSGKRYRYSVKR